VPPGSAIQIVDLRKRYAVGGRVIDALAGVSLTVAGGEFLCVMGPSGSGKSTLLNLVAGLDRPTGGEIIVDGSTLSALDDDALTDLRRTRVGVVFQFFNLLPDLSARDNVALPLRARGRSRRDAIARALEALASVGLADRAAHLPKELSGGEMQRVALARALAIEPVVLLADEPTGNLDSASGALILDLLRRSRQAAGLTVVMVTHSKEVAATADRVVVLRDGALVDGASAGD